MICTVVYGGIGLFRQAHSDLIVNIFDMSDVIRFWIPFYILCGWYDWNKRNMLSYLHMYDKWNNATEKIYLVW